MWQEKKVSRGWPHIIFLVPVALHDGDDTVVDEVGQREGPSEAHEGVLEVKDGAIIFKTLLRCTMILQ